MRRALAIDEKASAPITQRRPRASTIWRTLLKDTNRLAEAEPLMRRALDILMASLGASSEYRRRSPKTTGCCSKKSKPRSRHRKAKPLTPALSPWRGRRG